MMHSLDELLSTLNPQQRAAVEHVLGPLLLIAGAGSGKTRVVTYRIARLLSQGIDPESILALTFTNKAAAEMRERVRKLTRAAILSCTFHSLALRILRQYAPLLGFTQDFAIYDAEDSEKILKECLKSLNIKGEKGVLQAKRADISFAKNQLNPPEKDEIYDLYQTRLKDANALDFDDLLFYAVQLFKHHPQALDHFQKRWLFILIDEYQDTNAAQCAIVEALAEKHRNVFVVGDPDQSIYSWRGADSRNILHFKNQFPEALLLTLEQNYRSRNTILQAANQLIAYNSSRFKKELWSEREDGPPIQLLFFDNEQEEANFIARKLRFLRDREAIPFHECALFYRTHFQSRSFEDALLKASIPYVIVGGISFYQRKEIKDILSYLRLLINGADVVSFTRLITRAKKGFGETSIEKLILIAQKENLDILQAAQRAGLGTFSLFSSKQKELLSAFTGQILSLKNLVEKGIKLSDLISEVLHRFHYLDSLKEEPEREEERRENVLEFLSKAMAWEEENESPSLSAFLQEISLHTGFKEESADQVRLMTFHNSKGLEFQAVFMVGMEEQLFPHINSQLDETAIEEERRLCYVGMTRAKDLLFCSAVYQRFLWGSRRLMRPSRFLKEIPSEYMETI
jgi:DNA helicase II / ATP-dependent DNA helicase PcrA